MNSNDASSTAVSPVVGVILVVAITVALSGAVGVLIFDLGQNTTNSTQSELGTRTTYTDSGTATIQVVTGEADKLRVLVNGTEELVEQDVAPGNSFSVTATTESSITIISEQNGESTIVSSSGAAKNTTPPTAPTTGLVAHYKLNGDETDASGNNYDGVPSGDPFYESAVDGQGVRLDGTDDFIDIPDAPFPVDGEDHTYSAWIKPDDVTQQYGNIVGNNGHYTSSIRLHNSNISASAKEDGGSYFSTNFTTPQDNTWYYITGVFNASTGTLTLYVNGSQHDQVTGWDGTLKDDELSGDYTYIGTRKSDGSGAFDGIIDDVRIYNRTLNKSEVSNMYEATK